MRRNYSNFSESSFLEALSSNLSKSGLLSQELNCRDESEIDRLVATLTHNVASALDLLAPVCTFRVTRPPAPWLSSALLDRIKSRNRLYRIARRSGSVLNWEIYRATRNKLTLDMRSARERFHLARLSDISEPSRLWRELANLGITESPPPTPVELFTCDELNTYYSLRMPSPSAPLMTLMK